LEASFLRETGSHTLFQRAQEGRALGGGLVWWVFLIGQDSWAFSGELVWFAPLLGEGKQS
jgi:hypothetical protein